MAYKFTGRIKKLGCEQQGINNFCEFDVDNTIKIGDKEQGIAYDDNSKLQIVPIFKNIKGLIFNILISCQNERLEIEYEKKKECENQNGSGKESESKKKDKIDTITKVTILK